MLRIIALLSALGWIACVAVASLSVFAALFTVFSLFRMPVVPSAFIALGLLLPVGAWIAFSQLRPNR